MREIFENLEDIFRQEVATEVALTPRTKVLWEEKKQRKQEQLWAERSYWHHKKNSVVQFRRKRPDGR